MQPNSSGVVTDEGQVGYASDRCSIGDLICGILDGTNKVAISERSLDVYKVVGKGILLYHSMELPGRATKIEMLKRGRAGKAISTSTKKIPPQRLQDETSRSPFSTTCHRNTPLGTSALRAPHLNISLGSCAPAITNSLKTWLPVVPTFPPGSPDYPLGTDPFGRYDSEWAHAILQEWEHEGSKGADPGDTRKYFKFFWVEEKEVLEWKQRVDLTVLRRMFEKLVDIDQRYPAESLHNSIASPNWGAFLYVDDEVTASLFDNKVEGNVPYAHVVQPDFPNQDGNCYIEYPEGPETHYKVAVELLR
ncbi:hypothetical protein BDZ45DRAFT_730601 [Acephala macrosclerotiorum]|nr:hypothetical protein BDZ45DRAFT_730601 [Acephala macrosclerotiorum]